MADSELIAWLLFIGSNLLWGLSHLPCVERWLGRRD